MSQILSPLSQPPDSARTLDEMVGTDGTGAHPYVRMGALTEAPEAMRNLADAVHFLSLLHGRHPGVVDDAALGNVDPEARLWLEEAVDAFADERAFLSQIIARAGPVPNTPDEQRSERAVAEQQRALTMLAQSERHGCAVGAALALALDWRTIRVLLDISAARLEINAQPSRLPDLRDTAVLANQLGATPAVQRAMLFGAGQLLIQHQALWNLMDARAKARGTI